VAEDPAETHNVAADNRDRLIAMISIWYAEAGKHGVLPIDGSGLARLISEKPLIAPPRDQYALRPNTQAVPFSAGPRVLNRPHSITAFVDIPDNGAEGVLLSQGTAAGGYSLFVQDKRLHYAHNYVGRDIFRVSSPEPVPTGKHELRFEFEPTGKPDLAAGKGAPGHLQLYVDGELVATADAPVTTPFAFNPGALACGLNPGSPVTPDYRSPFKFTGTIDKVVIDVSGELIHDPELELRAHLARQ
jgi:arylsulfatase